MHTQYTTVKRQLSSQSTTVKGQSSPQAIDAQKHTPQSAYGFSTPKTQAPQPQVNIVHQKTQNSNSKSNVTSENTNPNLGLKPHTLQPSIEDSLKNLDTNSSYRDYADLAKQNLTIEQLQTLIEKLTQHSNPQLINGRHIIHLINIICDKLKKALLINHQNINLEQITTLTRCIANLGNKFSSHISNNQDLRSVISDLQHLAVIKLNPKSTIEDFIVTARLNLDKYNLAEFIQKLNVNQKLETINNGGFNQLTAILFDKYIDTNMLALDDYVTCMQNITTDVSLEANLCNQLIHNLTAYSGTNCFLFIAQQKLSIDQIKALHQKFYAHLAECTAAQIYIDTNTLAAFNNLLVKQFINQLEHKSSFDDYDFLFNALDVSLEHMHTLLSKYYIDISHMQNIQDCVNLSKNHSSKKQEFNNIINYYLNLPPEVHSLTNAINDDLERLHAQPITKAEIDYILQLHASITEPIYGPILLSKNDYTMLTRSVTFLSNHEILIHPFQLKNMNKSHLISRGTSKIVKSSAIKIQLHPDKPLCHQPIVTVSQSPRPNNSGHPGVMTKDNYLVEVIDEMAKKDGFTRITSFPIINGEQVLREKYYKEDLGHPLYKIKDRLTPEEKIDVSRQIIQQFRANPTINDIKEDNTLYESMLTIHRRNLYPILEKLPRNDELVNPIDYRNRLKQEYKFFNNGNYNKLLSYSSGNPNKLVPFELVLKTLDPLKNINFIDSSDPAFTYTTKNDTNSGRYDKEKDNSKTEQQRFFGISYLLYRLYEPRNTRDTYGAAWNSKKKPDALTLNLNNPFAEVTQILYQGKIQYNTDEVLLLLENAVRNAESKLCQAPPPKSSVK